MAKAFGFAVDRGGTFTDIYCQYLEGNQKKKVVKKLLSQDPANYRDAPTEGIRRILEQVIGDSLSKQRKIPVQKIGWIRMGTTVATNALLERKGESTALLVTKGFKDLLQIGNQSRPDIFALNIKRHQPLFEEVLEIDQRVILDQEGSEIGITGEKFTVQKQVDQQVVFNQISALKQRGINSLAVCLVHSYSFPEHQKQIEAIAIRAGFNYISLSSQIMPKVKFYPRASTACVDAYLTPKIKQYIQNFQSGFQSTPNVMFMQSDGGLVSMDNFMGSRSILSGPAGGVVGFSNTGPPPMIGFDMGGTSTDVSRYNGNFQHIFQTEIAGVPLQSPHLDINTVAAGGGSRLFFQSGLYKVGPQSAGAHPGPLAYRKKGYLTITDANIVLGRLLIDYFPKIFGQNEDQGLDYQAAYEGMKEIAQEINEYSGSELRVQEVAYGFIRVANQTMCRPIRELTQAKGYELKDHTLACFGGAGGQHACAIARNLGIQQIVVHKYSGILSAYGIGLADVVYEVTFPVLQVFSEQTMGFLREKVQETKGKVVRKLEEEGFDCLNTLIQEYVHLRFEGTDNSLPVQLKNDPIQEFKAIYRREFGFLLTNREVCIDQLRVRGLGKSSLIQEFQLEEKAPAFPIDEQYIYLQINSQLQKVLAPVFKLEQLSPLQEIQGPAIILNSTSTILVQFQCTAKVNKYGNLNIEVKKISSQLSSLQCDPILLSVFGHRFMSIAQQMGRTLQRTSISTNIKQRLDYSCAIFSPQGSLVANAPHLPVHLGSMQEAVKAQIEILGNSWKQGEVVVSNHPCAGGSHLPDLTVITPVFYQEFPVFYVASRGHHADIGGISPGSMPPFSKFLSEQGISIRSFKLVQNGLFKQEQTRVLFRESRCLQDNISDIKAQIAANNKGISLIQDLISEYSLEVVHRYMRYIQTAAQNTVRDLLAKFTQEKLEAVDYMDDGTPINLSITINQTEKSAFFDFSGTGFQVLSNLNTPPAVVKSAILYCLRCLVNSEIPLNQGCLVPIQIYIPNQTILSPTQDAAVVGGNVLTSQRITDVIFKAFKACAASQGCMNNLTFGSSEFGFYQTIAGGSGAGKSFNGTSGVHTHMTNTRITDIQIMERRYPVIVRVFSIRDNSGGKGAFKGGDGVIRELEFRKAIQVSILSERRSYRPYGLEGGEPGLAGRNIWIRQGVKINVGAKNSFEVSSGDRVRIESPGGGGYGPCVEEQEIQMSSFRTRSTVNFSEPNQNNLVLLSAAQGLLNISTQISKLFRLNILEKTQAIQELIKQSLYWTRAEHCEFYAYCGCKLVPFKKEFGESQFELSHESLVGFVAKHEIYQIFNQPANSALYSSFSGSTSLYSSVSQSKIQITSVCAVPVLNPLDN